PVLGEEVVAEGAAADERDQEPLGVPVADEDDDEAALAASAVALVEVVPGVDGAEAAAAHRRDVVLPRDAQDLRKEGILLDADADEIRLRLEQPAPEAAVEALVLLANELAHVGEGAELLQRPGRVVERLPRDRGGRAVQAQPGDQLAGRMVGIVVVPVAQLL